MLTLLTLAPAAAEPKLTVTWMEMPVHGLTAVVVTPAGKVLLVDAGGVREKPEHNSYNAGRDAVTPFLKSKGLSEIDALVVSHPHGDHYGGAEWLMKYGVVKQFIDHGYEGRAQTTDYTRLRELAQKFGGSHRVVVAGDVLKLDPAITIEVISPPAGFIAANSDPAKVSDHGLLNMNSVVLRLQHGENVFLFPGDCYGGAFETYLKTLPAEKLRTTVLTAPHHGFNPGYDFPQMALPKFVVASCLADYPANANTPHPRSPGDNAIKVYGALGAQVFVTAFQGNITAVSDGQTVTVTPSRQREAR